jgi:NADPH-dependent ferric siderophore reductase
MNTNSPQRRVQRVRHELRRRNVHIHSIERLDDGFVSITFHGEDLVDFNSASFDDHIKFIFTNAAGETVMRDYTPRHFDTAKRELTIEFALHGHGQASDWAAAAKLGMPATIGGPRGSMIIPMDYDWHLLIGDSSALPAITRRLEELPSNSQVHVMLLLDAAAQPRTLPGMAKIQHFDDSEKLLASVQALSLPAGEGFAWAAGEASLMKRIRKELAVEKGHPKEAMRVAAYWRHGAEGFHEELTEQESD